MKVPCKDCICIAICRQKHFRDLLCHCHIISGFLFTDVDDEDGNDISYVEAIFDIEEILSPSEWSSIFTKLGKNNVLPDTPMLRKKYFKRRAIKIK
jgi:hypothetical protein